MLLKNPEQFVEAMTSKLLMFALDAKLPAPAKEKTR